MTKQEINDTIREYWNELYQTEELQSIDYCIWRVAESRKIGNYLILDALMGWKKWLQEGNHPSK